VKRTLFLAKFFGVFMLLDVLVGTAYLLEGGRHGLMVAAIMGFGALCSVHASIGYRRQYWEERLDRAREIQIL